MENEAARVVEDDATSDKYERERERDEEEEEEEEKEEEMREIPQSE